MRRSLSTPRLRKNHLFVVLIAIVLILGGAAVARREFFNEPREALSTADRLSPQGARNALLKLGQPVSLEGFIDASRDSDPDLIALYLRAGISPNVTSGDLFVLEIPLIRNTDRFAELLKLYRNKGFEPLDFNRRNQAGKTLEYELFSQISPSDDHALENGQILVEAGASPQSLLDDLAIERQHLTALVAVTPPRKGDIEDGSVAHDPDPQRLLTRLEGRISYLESFKR